MTNFVDKLFKAVNVLMAVFLALMVGMMFMNVLLRFVFSIGLVWSEEIARLCFIYLVYFGTIGAFRDNQHLGVDTLLDKVPPKVKVALYAIVQVLIVWVMWMLVRGSWDLSVQNLNDRWTATHYPRALIFGAGVVTGAAIMLLGIANLVRLFVMKIPVDELLKIRSAEAEAGVDASAG